MQTSLIVGALLVVLLWWTTWPALRPGLLLLCLGRFLAAYLFARRNYRQLRSNAGFRNASLEGFLASERQFLRKIKLLYALPQAAGFVVLAGGVWMHTGNWAIAFALGVLYPLIMTLGVWRMYDVRRMSALTRGKAEKSL